MGPVATDRRQERDCNARGGGWRWGLKQPLEEGQIPELCVPLAWATELWAGQGQTVGPKERRSEVGSEVLRVMGQRFGDRCMQLFVHGITGHHQEETPASGKGQVLG